MCGAGLNCEYFILNVIIYRAEPWFEELYLQKQIEKDRLIALEMQKQFEKEIKERNKKRRSEYTLRSSAKKKKPGKHSPRRQIKLETMLDFIPRKLSY